MSPGSPQPKPGYTGHGEPDWAPGVYHCEIVSAHLPRAETVEEWAEQMNRTDKPRCGCGCGTELVILPRQGIAPWGCLGTSTATEVGMTDGEYAKLGELACLTVGDMASTAPHRNAISTVRLDTRDLSPKDQMTLILVRPISRTAGCTQRSDLRPSRGWTNSGDGFGEHPYRRRHHDRYGTPQPGHLVGVVIVRKCVAAGNEGPETTGATGPGSRRPPATWHPRRCRSHGPLEPEEMRPVLPRPPRGWSTLLRTSCPRHRTRSGGGPIGQRGGLVNVREAAPVALPDAA